MTTTYSTVVISQSSYRADGGAIIERACGHKHRSLKTAKAYHSKLTASDKFGNCRADFYHGQVRHSDGSKLSDDEASRLESIGYAR